MSRSIFQPEWRTQSRRKRRFYARYMGWLEKTGFVVVGLLVAGFVGSFFYRVDEWVSAEDVEIQTAADGSAFFVEASLAGKSIANAKPGQPAKLSNIRIQASGDTLLRANLEGSTQGHALSRTLAGQAVKQALESTLVGRSVRAREDMPLQITGIGDVEVEATLRTAPATNATAAFDPGIDVALTGQVLEGKHVLSAQLGDLPRDVREAAVEALRRKLVGQSVQVAGQSQAIEEVLDPRFVVRLDATNAGDKAGALQAASLKRSYEAKIELADVPLELADQIRVALREGKKVSAKVQVRTGSRPIAYFLLRRS